jgi:hypothetical protein
MDVMRTTQAIASLVVALAAIFPLAILATSLGCTLSGGQWCAAWLIVAGWCEAQAEQQS